MSSQVDSSDLEMRGLLSEFRMYAQKHISGLLLTETIAQSDQRIFTKNFQTV